MTIVDNNKNSIDIKSVVGFEPEMFTAVVLIAIKF